MRLNPTLWHPWPAAGGWTESVVYSAAGAAVLYKASGLSFSAPTGVGLLAMRFLHIGPTWTSSILRLFAYATAGGAERFRLATASSGRLYLTMIDSSGVTKGTWTANTSTFAVDTVYHIACSWDLPNSILQVYINGSSAAETKTASPATLDAIGRAGIGGTFSGSAGMDGKYGPVVFDPSLSTFFDLSVGANMAKLYSGGAPVDPGDGTPIVGSQMAVVIDGNAAVWNNTSGNNQGYAGNLGISATNFTDSTF